jgi:diaminopimelate epimerase
LIPFTKAHACGNDFLIVTEDDAGGYNWAELARRLCARTTSIGADGVEFFAWTGPRSGRIRLHNADGSIAEISGNGTRCVAAWMAHALCARSRARCWSFTPTRAHASARSTRSAPKPASPWK